MNFDNGQVFIAYDITLNRPGCAIIQGAMGGSSEAAQEFPTELWILSPTPDMKVYPVVSAEFLDMLVRKSLRHNIALMQADLINMGS